MKWRDHWALGSLFKTATISPEVVERHPHPTYYGSSPTEPSRSCGKSLLCLSRNHKPNYGGGLPAILLAGKKQGLYLGGGLEKRPQCPITRSRFKDLNSYKRSNCNDTRAGGPTQRNRLHVPQVAAGVPVGGKNAL